jgi:hypothetical protein
MEKNLRLVATRVSRQVRTNKRLALFIGGGIMVVIITSAITYKINHDANHRLSVGAKKTSAVAHHPKKQPKTIQVLLAPPVAPKPAPPPPAPVSKVVFSDPLNGPNRIVTNEFVHWSKSSCPYTSSLWDMTSGTLLIRNGVGYSGIPTLEKTVACESSNQTNSAIFRLNTKASNFSNVTISMDYNAVAHGGAGAPVNAYDGIHIWAGYQSQYALYAATIFRWDGNLVIKKKVPVEQAKCTDPSNSGCYYNVTPENVYRDITTANAWHHADVIFQANANGTTTLTERIDGRTIFQGIDNNLHGAAYRSGAVGVRGDNTEFYFKNFTVTQL